MQVVLVILDSWFVWQGLERKGLAAKFKCQSIAVHTSLQPLSTRRLTTLHYCPFFSPFWKSDLMEVLTCAVSISRKIFPWPTCLTGLDDVSMTRFTHEHSKAEGRNERATR